MTLKPYLISRIALVWIVYPLFCHFGSLEQKFDPRGKIGRIYVELHVTLLYIKYTSFVLCCCREDFFIYFHYKSMVDNDMPGAWPVWTPGAPFAAFIKRTTTHW